MRKTSTLLSGLAFAFLAIVPCLHASASEFVYVESNIQSVNGNSIYAFERRPDGSLASVAGSPFATQGAGVQDTSLKVGPSDSDQDIVASPDHSLLFAVNSGSDTIAVFHIQNSGALKPVEGSPFASGGTNPVSLALHGETLFVVNKNGDFPRLSNTLPNYTALHVDSNGALSPIEGKSRISVALGSSPTQALLAPHQNLMIGADFLGGLIQRFDFDEDGHLGQRPPMALPPSEFSNPAVPRLPLGLWAHPTEPILYVGFVTASKLGVYKYGPGQIGLQFIRTVPNSGKAICWLRTNHSGTRLYSSDTTSNSISVYDLADPWEPVETQNLVLAGLGNVLQFELAGDGKYLYALSSRGDAGIPEGEGNALHILKVGNDGSVSEIDKSPVLFSLPAGTRPQGVAVVSN